MRRKFFPEWLISLAVLVIACGLSLYLRVGLPYGSVFDGQWIKFTSNDAYFYMRIVDNLVQNFPQLYSFDPYWVFPGGFATGNLPAFFAYLLAGTVKLLGGASPSQQAIDTILVYVPAILGTLAIIPVYFIGRALVNRWAGIIAAIVLAVMPGQLLALTILGNVNHHAAEVLLTSCFAVFFILAIKHGRHFTYDLLIKGQFPEAGEHLPFALAAGVFLGLYLITWTGALLLIFIVFVYFIIQFISDHLRGFPTDYLSKVAITCFLVALLVFLPASRDKLTLLSLATVMLAPVALNILSAVMSAREVKRCYFPAIVAALVALGALAAWLIFPAQFNTAANYISGLLAWKLGPNVIGEMRPLFFTDGMFTMETAWSQYALVFYPGLAGLALIIYRSIRTGESEHIFMAVLSIIMMLASFAMSRFSIYFAVCLALLTGYLAGWIIEANLPLKTPGHKVDTMTKARGISASPKVPLRTVLVSAATGAAVFIMLIPGAIGAVNSARYPAYTPGNSWMAAMEWMKKNTPEPFGNADFYYKIYNTPAQGKAYAYPVSFYSVAAWSDYGYLITRIGHRVPTSNPGTYPIDEAGYFTGQDADTAAGYMSKWQARYVAVDNRMASANDNFSTLANLNNKSATDFYELCWQLKDSKYEPLLVYYPEFYRSMLVRLYYFDGKKVVPQNTVIMTYRDQVTADGQRFKEITALNKFTSYNNAEAFISDHKDGQYRIIGTDPLCSPVPLGELNGYKSVYQSEQTASPGPTALPAVKIFEYTRP